MKKTILAIALALVAVISVNAQTNSVATTNAVTALTTNAPAEKLSGNWELTLGGGGETFEGESYFGLDFSLSTNPLEARPEVWVGIAQSLYWEPSFAGSTDLYVDWSQSITDSINVNVGWSGGVLYDNDSETEHVWRTGPEATVQYYTADNAFIYAGVNYDVYRSDKNEGGFRYSFGIGLSF